MSSQKPVFMKSLFITISVIFAVSLFSAVAINAQDIAVTKSSTNAFEPVGNISSGFDEQSLREMMKNDGLTEPVINKLIKERKQLAESGRNLKWTNLKTTAVTNALCNDMGVENGWGAWMGDLGTALQGSQTWTPPPGPPTAANFSITIGAGFDPNAPITGNLTIPYVCPGFGKASIRIGEACVPGFVAEQLTYPIPVTAQDTNFMYSYAMVIEAAGHGVLDQPFVQFCILDPNGNPIPCACFRYTGGAGIPGFYPVSGNGCAWATDQYKPWTTIGINLSAYIGMTLTAVITHVDCTQGGHWAYSYWDFSCGKTIEPEYCSGQQITLCTTFDPSIAYTYQWSTGATTQCITVTPNQNDTFSVAIQQPSGCNFNLMYVPKDTCLTGVNETLNSSISIFPNPSSGNFFVDFGNMNFGKAEVSFSDIIGQTLSEINIPASGKQVLNVSEFSEGIYFLKMKTETGEVTKKIVIGH